jgi:hypothetical protein
MKPATYRKAIARLGLSQLGAGKLVGRSGRSSQRWVVTGPPPEAAIVFQLLLDGKVTIADVEAARERVNRSGK